MDRRSISEEYAQIGQEWVQNDDIFVDIRNSQATIVYLVSEHKKSANGKVIFAQCEKVADKYKWGIPADFTITVFEPNVEGFSEEQKKELIFHELLHVGIVFNADGTENYNIRPHDLEDFKEVINRWGTDWSDVDEREDEG